MVFSYREDDKVLTPHGEGTVQRRWSDSGHRLYDVLNEEGFREGETYVYYEWELQLLTDNTPKWRHNEERVLKRLA